MNALQQIAARFPHARVLVVGDVMLDVYIFGRCTRISQEAPVPVFVEDRRDTRMGGAGNVDAQLKALGAHTVSSWTPGVRTHKFRYFHGHSQVFRQDEDHIARPSEHEIAKTASFIHGHGCQAVVLSDYAKGWLTPAMCQSVIAEAQLRGVPVVVDPKGTDWLRYHGATVLCPNEEEWAAFRDELINTTSIATALVRKLGEKGLCVSQPPSATLQIPARARHVYDVTGAGDTVTAVIAAGLAVGASLADAARIANVAAGYVVGEVGTATCPLDKLIELLGSENGTV